MFPCPRATSYPSFNINSSHLHLISLSGCLPFDMDAQGHCPPPTFSRLFLQVAVLRGYNNICNTPQDDLRERKEGKGDVLFYLLLNYKLQAFFYDKGGDTFFPPRASYVVRILFPGHTKSSTSKFSCNTQSNIRFIEVPVSLCLF